IPSPQERRVGIVHLKRPTAAREKDANDSKSYEDNFQTEYSEHGDAWLDEPDPDGPKVNAKLIEASSLVDLDAPEVEDCLSDEAPAGLKNRREALNGSNKKVAVQQDEALTEEDWDF
ncbi:hypothetical protein FRC07_005596, partial [Ceratobasidium sp. 392]